VTRGLGVALVRRALREQVLKVHLPLDAEPMVCYALGDALEREMGREAYIPKGSKPNDTYNQRTRCLECKFEPREGFEQDEQWYEPIVANPPEEDPF
jgi:hypothetical protein